MAIVWLEVVAQGVVLLPMHSLKSKPVPESASVEPAVNALSLTVSVPLRAPALAGVKVKPAVQLAPAASVAPQVVLARLNSAAGEGVSVRLLRLVTLSGLVMVTVLTALVTPSPVCAKTSGLGWKATEPGTPPAPLSSTVAEEASEDEAMVSVPV